MLRGPRRAGELAHAAAESGGGRYGPSQERRCEVGEEVEAQKLEPLDWEEL